MKYANEYHLFFRMQKQPMCKDRKMVFKIMNGWQKSTHLIHFHMIKENGKENDLCILKTTLFLATQTDLWAYTT